MLLSGAKDGQLERALLALQGATGAPYVFVERNVMQEGVGLCSDTVAEVKHGVSGRALRNAYWEMVPWDNMPISRSYMERGKHFFLIPAELDGVEKEYYANSPESIESELDIPIFVDDRWEGLIGFADLTHVRQWTDGEIALLEAAAGMVGAYWEREAVHAELQSALKAKDDLVAAVSHELRTPLTTIVGLSDELRHRFTSFDQEEVEALLDLICSQGADMAHLVDDLLVMARAESGHVHVDRAEVDLLQQVEAVTSQLSSDVPVTCRGRAVAVGDAFRIRQIVRNLLTNAVRYGGDRVEVLVSHDASTSELAVTDNGPGIPEEDRQRIFEPYERAHWREGLTQSVGLGLAVSRQLARLMGGDLTYSFEAGRSTFTLKLPAPG